MKCIICKLGVFALFGVLVLSPFNYALANAYSRTPAGSVITSPVNILSQRDSPPNTGQCGTDFAISRYRLAVVAMDATHFPSTEFNGNALIAGVNRDINLPVGDYERVRIQCIFSGDMTETWQPVLTIENIGVGVLLFSVIEPPPTPTPTPTPPTFSGSLNKTDLISNIGAVSTNLFDDFGQGGILEMIIGISLGLMLLTWAINKFRRRR